MTAGSIAVPQIIPLRYPLGKKKNLISLNTQIEIKTETKNCNVFYTLNNKKPDPFQKYGQKCTYRYKSPFTLAAGNVTIKALAMTVDGSNCSSVVTKVFIVSDAAEESYEIPDGEEPGSRMTQLDMSLSEQFKERVRTLSRESVRTNISSSTQLQTADSPKLKATSSPTPPPHDLQPSTPSKFIPSIAPLTQSSPIFPPSSVAMEKPQNVCLYCSYPRGLKSTEVHCTNCGSKLPPLPHKKKEAVRMSVCPSCQSEQAPSDSSNTCLVCSTVLIQPPPLPSIKSQQATRANIEMESILCLYCGTHNSPQLLTCVTCANTLYTGNGSDIGSLVTKETIMHPITGSTFVMCATCGRVNVSDARCCDWCGCRPIGSNVDLVCQNCDSPNDWTARHCSQCGFIMKCPLRPEIEQGSKMRMPAGSKFNHGKWIPIADVDTPMEDKGILAQAGSQTVGTQTKGLFYASANTISAKKANEAWQKMTKTISQDRVIGLSSYSPGNGKWRSQIDHICIHLKAHSATSSELQNDISNCQIGAIKRSSVQVDKDNLQLTLSLIFALKDITNASNSVSGYLSSSQVVRAGTAEKFRRSNSIRTSAESSLRRSSSSNTLTKKPILKRASTINLKVEDYLLSAEVGPDGSGRRDIILGLIQKGANINYIDTTRGLPLLLLATSSGHLEAVKVFLEEGANLTVASKKNLNLCNRTGNTALHEAVKLGDNGGDILTALLRYGANSNARNRDNLTACELANKLGHQSLITRFASHLGTSMLGPLAKKPSENSKQSL